MKNVSKIYEIRISLTFNKYIVQNPNPGAITKQHIT